MSKLIGALKQPAQKTNITTTTNNMSAFKSTNDACLDLFGLGASYRQRSNNEIITLFEKAYKENRDLALKILAYFRDPRHGLGERRFFRVCLPHISDVLKDKINLSVIPELGRWDDLLCLIDSEYEDLALDVIAQGIKGGDGLCAKWMPRKGRIARIVREHLRLYPKQYRKTLVQLTQVVETQMCNREWENIKYEHVPSRANIVHNDAFLRNDGERRRRFLEAVKSGKAKINVSVVNPHEIVGRILRSGTTSLSSGEALRRLLTKDDMAIAMWDKLPNLLHPSFSCLVMADLSGSMGRPYSSDDTPIRMSIAIALYISQHQEGLFQNAFITFTGEPYLQYVEGNLYERMASIVVQHPRNTNIESAFKLVLDTAVKHKLSEDEMPKNIMIISDMEFDRACNSPGDGVFALIRKQYADAGYDMPDLIFWNVNAKRTHFVIERNNRGVALLSGSSQNAITSVMKGIVNPKQVMIEAVSKPLYERFISANI